MSDFWDQAGGVVATVAPVLGTALGGPLGGAAAGILVSALGLNKDATPSQVAAAVQGATPEQIMALKAADQAFLTRSMELAAQVSQGQAETNKAEAGASGWFIAGWRPFVGWVCGAALAWDQVIGPLAFSLIHTHWPDKEMVHVDTATLMPLLMGMLGIGAMRTIEKLNGVAGGEIIRTPRQKSQDAAPAAQVTLDHVAVPIVIPRPVAAPEPIEPVIIAPPPEALPANRKPFFDVVRGKVFNGHLVQSQVEGCERLLDFWNTFCPTGDKRHLAYILATTCWETGRTMQPIEEVGRGANRFYGASGFYGRGYVQLTLEDNYRRMSSEVGIDLVVHPERALEVAIALKILFVGMTKGLFTGKKLSDFFNDTTSDPVGARAIINGTDHAADIAGMYQSFLAALDAETSA